MSTQLHTADPDGENEPIAAHGDFPTGLGRCHTITTHRRAAGTAMAWATAKHPRGGDGRFRHAWHEMREHADRGLATAEYAIATIAAAGFAGLLIVVLKSGTVRTLLEGIVQSALNV
ncbi:hypothetical protein GCM10010401_06340 [Rarobacter faecitabidus]|uniref:Uncharacterized protein DUF4244 n=1 Tax=Rarobacter faecitabidus TaxID=13243 RepID=A0A542ZTM7_RARFA|nr:DUF4244 domain-containing protein [Rarobacter faecitabidus]TQL63616.1 uncharacterized protein DUF4244 [Rarobacter faecitabidus]